MMTLVLSLSLSLVSPLQTLRGASRADLAEEAAPASRGVRQVTLEIDHTRLLEQESAESVQDTVAYVRGDGVAALKDRHGVEAIEGAEAPAIIVSLSWVRHDDSVYGVSVKTRRPGQEARVVETFECECIDSGLSKAVLERLPAALGQLAEVTAEPAGVGEPEVEAEVEVDVEVREPDAGVEEDVEPWRARPLGAMGKAGIGLLSAGAAGMVAGGVVFIQHQRLGDNEKGGRYRNQVDFEPAGVTAMAIGGAALVTGAALLIVDRGLGRRASQEARAQARLWPTATGLLLTGRF